MERTVVLGLGNLLMGDEGIGVHVVRRLKEDAWPPNVEFVDGGTSAFDLLPVLARADCVVVVDAIRGGGEPGTLYRFPMDQLGKTSGEDGSLSLHQVSLQDVVEMASRLDIAPAITVIGVEPKRVTLGMELSAEIRDVVPRIYEAIRSTLAEWPLAIENNR